MHVRLSPLALTRAAVAACSPLQAYASLYSGRTRAVRLMFAADRGGAGVELEALRLAAVQLKAGEDTAMYTQVRKRRPPGRVGGRCVGRVTQQPYCAAHARRAAR